MRVYRTAINIAEAEHADMQVVALAALLHDVDDRKLSPMTAEKKENAARFMRSQNVSESEIRQVCQIIDEVSFKGTDSVRPPTPEGKCVQDADRLDALGAIGIARTFAYGGSHNRAIYDPELPPRTAMNQAQYYSSKSTSLNHFYEKLFLLEGMMNTETGKAIARKRTQYMQQFVDEFLHEWDGLNK
jgi:metal dependent phosphohydrolase